MNLKIFCATLTTAILAASTPRLLQATAVQKHDPTDDLVKVQAKAFIQLSQFIDTLDENQKAKFQDDVSRQLGHSSNSVVNAVDLDTISVAENTADIFWGSGSGSGITTCSKFCDYIKSFGTWCGHGSVDTKICKKKSSGWYADTLWGSGGGWDGGNGGGGGGGYDDWECKDLSKEFWIFVKEKCHSCQPTTPPTCTCDCTGSTSPIKCAGNTLPQCNPQPNPACPSGSAQACNFPACADGSTLYCIPTNPANTTQSTDYYCDPATLTVKCRNPGERPHCASGNEQFVCTPLSYSATCPGGWMAMCPANPQTPTCPPGSGSPQCNRTTTTCQCPTCSNGSPPICPSATATFTCPNDTGAVAQCYNSSIPLSCSGGQPTCGPSSCPICVTTPGNNATIVSYDVACTDAGTPQTPVCNPNDGTYSGCTLGPAYCPGETLGTPNCPTTTNSVPGHSPTCSANSPVATCPGAGETPSCSASGATPSCSGPPAMCGASGCTCPGGQPPYCYPGGGNPTPTPTPGGPTVPGPCKGTDTFMGCSVSNPHPAPVCSKSTLGGYY